MSSTPLSLTRSTPSSLTPMDTSTNSQPQPVAPARAFVDVGSITSTDTGTSGTSENVENVPSASPDFKNVKFKDVIVSNKKTNIVSNNFKKTMTQLYSVMGISTVDITNPQMKVIAKGLGIRNSRTFLLATKGMSLTKGELTEGLKQDQILHTKIAEEYNKDIPEYVGNAFPDIAQGRMINASYYDKINWQKSKATFTSLSNEYDKVFYNWKRSGFHGEFPEEEGAEQGTEPHSEKKNSEFCTRQSIDFIYAQIRGTISGLPLFHYE